MIFRYEQPASSVTDCQLATDWLITCSTVASGMSCELCVEGCRKAQLPAKTGEPWTEEEDRKLLASFDAGRALQELAAAHERTMGAVRARLLKYGRINA